MHGNQSGPIVAEAELTPDRMVGPVGRLIISMIWRLLSIKKKTACRCCSSPDWNWRGTLKIKQYVELVQDFRWNSQIEFLHFPICRWNSNICYGGGGGWTACGHNWCAFFKNTVLFSLQVTAVLPMTRRSIHSSSSTPRVAGMALPWPASMWPRSTWQIKATLTWVCGCVITPPSR